MNATTELELTPETRFLDKPRLVLFDDDPFFVRMMEQYARQHCISLTGVWRMDDIPEIANRDFDLAIVDFDLGDISGIELASFLEEVFGELPLILISHSQRMPGRKQLWPESIRSFVLKEDGPAKIFDTALHAHATTARWRKPRSTPIFYRA